MKKLFSLFMLWMSVLCMQAQEIRMKSMELLSNDLTARVQSRQDLNGNFCALVKVQLPIEGLQFEGNVIGKTEYHTNEYFVYMTSGSKGLMIRHPKYQTLFVNFNDLGISSVETRNTYGLKLEADRLDADTVMVVDTIKVQTPVSVAANSNISYQIDDSGVLTIKDIPVVNRPFSMYAEGKFQLGSLMGVGGGIGTYINRINLEAFAIIGMSESDEVFWIPSDVTKTAYSYTYKAVQYGVKIGYAIPIGEKFRFTPQVGLGISSISGTEKQRGTGSDPKATDAYVIPVSVGVRVEALFGNHFGISLTPEFSFAGSKSDAFTRITDAVSSINGFGQGFNAKLGVFVCF